MRLRIIILLEPDFKCKIPDPSFCLSQIDKFAPGNPIIDLLEAEKSIRDVVIEPDTKIIDLLPERAEVSADELVTVTMFEVAGVPPPVAFAPYPTGLVNIIRSLRLCIKTD